MRRRRNNPPWVDTVLRTHCGALRSAAKRMKLPMPLLEREPDCGPAKELGAGFYGVVFPSEKPGVVLKITRSEHEAHTVAAMMELERRGVVPDGIVRYYGVLSNDTGRRFFIWREEADYVGEWWQAMAMRRLGRRLAAAKAVTQQELDVLDDRNMFAGAVQRLDDIAGYVWDFLGHLRRISTLEDYWRTVGLNWRAVSGNAPEDKRSRSDIRRAIHDDDIEAIDDRLRIAYWVLRGELMAKRARGIDLAQPIADAWLEYLHHGMMIDDLHDDNYGVRRGSEYPIITDCGAVSILNRELSALPIEVLKP